MFLRKLGYEDVAIAVSGEEVLAVWAAKERDSGGGSGSDSGVFDVILMDVNMDGMDGIECTRQLRSRTTGQRVYIIAQTANANTESKHKCIDAGMDSFLPKVTPLHSTLQHPTGTRTHTQLVTAGSLTLCCSIVALLFVTLSPSYWRSWPVNSNSPDSSWTRETEQVLVEHSMLSRALE